MILRGNSGSGKSTVARQLRDRVGRGVAWIEQDCLRRILLREHDLTRAVNIGFIDQTARYALDAGYDVIVEGILNTCRYGLMLRELTADHRGRTGHHSLDVHFEETVRRHAGRPQAAHCDLPGLQDGELGVVGRLQPRRGPVVQHGENAHP